MTPPAPDHTAWYLRCRPEQVADRAVLVGDRDRVRIAAGLLDGSQILNESRGLTTVTGSWRGTRLTVSAFGMGAPIAAVVLHELASIGVHTAVRLGTVLAVGETALGDFVVADSALAYDGTSRSYGGPDHPAASDSGLVRTLAEHGRRGGATVRIGSIASFDGFYSEMFGDPQVPGSSSADFAALAARGVCAADMETAAVLTVGRFLGVKAASMCLASVDARTHAVLEPGPRTAAEERLLLAGFDALVDPSIG